MTLSLWQLQPLMRRRIESVARRHHHEEHDHDYVSAHEDEVVFVLPNVSRKAGSGSFLNTAAAYVVHGERNLVIPLTRRMPPR